MSEEEFLELLQNLTDEDKLKVYELLQALQECPLDRLSSLETDS